MSDQQQSTGLQAFGVEAPEPVGEENADDDGGDLDRADGATITDQCQETTADGDRCQNAVTPRVDGPYCTVHGDRDD